MQRIDYALDLAARGFHVFPVEPDGKVPAIKDFPNRATRDADQIRQWWDRADYNIGISTTKFGDSQALVVVDVDVKKGKDGNATLFELELTGHELPASLEQSTPSGGRHIVYASAHACKQGVDVLGTGLDIRSQGGFIVGPGSEIGGRKYAQINGHGTPVPAPQWLLDRLGSSRAVEPRASVQLVGVDPDRANARAVAYLQTAPVSVEGEGGDITAFKVACKLKDIGCTAGQALELLDNHWNQRCDPPWPVEDLAEKVAHAYRYGKEPQGSAAPEAVFQAAKPAEQPEDPGMHPLAKLNQEFAFVKKGAFVLQETTDMNGNPATEHLNMAEFHGWFANVPFQTGNGKPRPISNHWLEWGQRRQYEAVVFAPQQDAGPRWYNLWTGFTVQPEAGSHPALDAFLEHALNNVCRGDKALCHWLMGFFAHLIQRPWEKPLVALVFQGKKGTGKNALVERIGALLGRHSMVADDERYLTSNFNAHLESNLLFILDEASWAGDKRAEGKLKGLITGQAHNIERKGQEGYRVSNLTRVVILGNEKWLVPATVDERRFAVFAVGDGRRQDRKFFESMRVGMEQGGYAHLLQFLLDFDLSTVDVNAAPSTQGLIDQKHASLSPVEEWWMDCLNDNQLVGSTFNGDLPGTLTTKAMYEAFAAWARQRNIRSRLVDRRAFVNVLRTMTPSAGQSRPRVDGIQQPSLTNLAIDKLRTDWEAYIGGAHHWED